MYCDKYSCLKPKFQCKREFLIGELELLPSQETSSGPLANVMDKTLEKESNNNNIVKDEVQTDNETMPIEMPESATDELGLIPVPALPSISVELPDATQNLLVSLPVETNTKLADATLTLGNETQPAECDRPVAEAAAVSELPNTIPCTINLTDISVKLVDGRMVLPSVPLEPKVIVEPDQYDLRQRPLPNKELVRLKRKAASNINYGIMDATSEEEELLLSDSECMNLPAKSAPSGYILATHKYMLAKHQG